MAKVQSIYPAFMDKVKGELLLDEPMSRHTSWRVGGVARYFFTPSNRADLATLLSQLPQHIRLHWIGLGSNLLVRDGGIEGMVIRSSKGLKQYQINAHGGGSLYAESGVACAQIARIAANNYLSGVEFLAGVPGSFGGALAMNAGAYGDEIWAWVESVDCVDRAGSVRTYAVSAIDFGYRRVSLPPDCGLLGGQLKLNCESREYRGRDKIRSLLAKRAASQPLQSAHAGSVFRNPPGDHAARLIEQAGLKGYCIGGAQISQMHANFIVNSGNATAADIEELIAYTQNQVLKKFSIALDPEVRILGERL